MPEPTSTSHYAALYGGDQPYFRLATITHPAGTIPPPFLELHQPLVGPVKMSFYNGSTNALARMYGLTSQTAAQYLMAGDPDEAQGGDGG